VESLQKANSVRGEDECIVKFRLQGVRRFFNRVRFLPVKVHVIVSSDQAERFQGIGRDSRRAPQLSVNSNGVRYVPGVRRGFLYKSATALAMFSKCRASSGVSCFSVSTNEGDTESGCCDAVASRPAHISCSVSSSSMEPFSMIGSSNRDDTTCGGNPASRRSCLVFCIIATKVLTPKPVLYLRACSVSKMEPHTVELLALQVIRGPVRHRRVPEARVEHPGRFKRTWDRGTLGHLLLLDYFTLPFCIRAVVSDRHHIRGHFDRYSDIDASLIRLRPILRGRFSLV
jgi:hypothetical protein